MFIFCECANIVIFFYFHLVSTITVFYDVGKIWIFCFEIENRSAIKWSVAFWIKILLNSFLQHSISTSYVTCECECWIPDHLIDLSPEFVLKSSKSSSFRVQLQCWMLSPSHRYNFSFGNAYRSLVQQRQMI